MIPRWPIRTKFYSPPEPALGQHHMKPGWFIVPFRSRFPSGPVRPTGSTGGTTGTSRNRSRTNRTSRGPVQNHNRFQPEPVGSRAEERRDLVKFPPSGEAAAGRRAESKSCPGERRLQVWRPPPSRKFNHFRIKVFVRHKNKSRAVGEIMAAAPQQWQLLYNPETTTLQLRNHSRTHENRRTHRRQHFVSVRTCPPVLVPRLSGSSGL